MMLALSIEVPATIVEVARVPLDDVKQTFRLELALALYQLE